MPLRWSVAAGAGVLVWALSALYRCSPRSSLSSLLAPLGVSGESAGGMLLGMDLIVLRMPTEAELAAYRLKKARRRLRRVPELVEKAVVRLAATPGREWSCNELMKSFCDASTRTEYGAEVWERLLATPGVVEGPLVVVGGRELRKVRWERAT